MPTTRRTVRSAALPAASKLANQPVMWINDDRVFYRSLLGAPSTRQFGSVVLYASLGKGIHVSIDGSAWQSGELAVVQPYVPHQVVSDDRTINVLKVEPETVDRAALPEILRAQGIVDAPQALARIRRQGQELSLNGEHLDLLSVDFDETFLGQRLLRRRLDSRIAQILERIKRNPSTLAVAEECAGEVGLSFSRFLHLFKEQTGASFRAFRSWKRARSLLHYVNRSANLTYIALDVGYPDATHFSHSIRRTYGLTPKDIFAGSRRLTILGQEGAAIARPVVRLDGRALREDS